MSKRKPATVATANGKSGCASVNGYAATIRKAECTVKHWELDIRYLRRKWSTRQLGMSDGLERAVRVMKELIKELKQHNGRDQ